MFGKNKCKYPQDLKIIFLISFLSTIFILIPPFSETPLRIPFALLLIFFIPGYAFISAMFPGNQKISGIERFTLSVGFSIVIMVFDGFLISLTSWKFRPNSITVSLVLLISIFGIIAYLARKRLPAEDQFCFSYKDFIHSLTEPETCNNDKEEGEICYDETIEDKRFAARNRKKISSMRKPSREKRKPALKTSERLSPEIARFLIIAMVFSIIVGSSMFAYAKVTREKETFTTLYILGPDGKAENYPENFSTSDPIHIIAGIENYEDVKENYTLEVILDGTTLNTMKITLGNRGKWEKHLTVAPTQSKKDRQKLELVLYKGDSEEQSYRTVYLWVNQVTSSEPIQTIESEIIDFVEMINPSMDLTDGWDFTTTNDSMVSGYYKNESGIYSSRAFIMNASYEGTIDEFTSSTLQQVIKSNEAANVILSCYIKDTYIKGTSNKEETQWKRIIFNGEIIWTDGVNGDEGWQHVEIPITLNEGNNTLSFVLLQGKAQALHPVELAIDEVNILPLSSLSPYVKEDNTVEFDLPESNIYPLPQSSKQNFTVEWNGTDSGTGISYYIIEYSTDGNTWIKWIDKTTSTSAEFEGKQKGTYYFRSIAVDNALNIEDVGIEPDTLTTVDISAPKVELDITPNPTSDITYLTVDSNKALLKVDCKITPRNFGSVESIELTTKDNVTWTGKYTIKVQDTFDIEVIATDYSNNTAYTFGTLYTDETLEGLTIDFNPEKTSDETTITVTSSTALKENPKVVVKDSSGYTLDVSFKESNDNEYVYIATTEDDDLDYSIHDGTARVIVTAKTADSTSLYEEDTFIIDRVEPIIESLTPQPDTTIETDSISIRASYSDNRAGIDKTKVELQVNGIDVTDSAEINSNSISYTTTGLNDGIVNVHLLVTDQAGNIQEEDWKFYVST